MTSFKYLFIFGILISCSTLIGQKSFEERLNSCFQSEKFISYFKLCSSAKDTVLVYDNTKTINIDKFFNLKCDKKIHLLAKTLAYDVNSSSLNRTDAIILLEYLEVKGKYSFHFINVSDNSSLRLSFNSKGELKNYESGIH